MATITLKNVPEEIHAALKHQAKLHKRSLNQEAIHCLDQAIGRGKRNAEEILARIRKSREGLPQVTLEFIQKAIKEGRE